MLVNSQSLDHSFSGKGYAETNFLHGNFHYEVDGRALTKSDGSVLAVFQINGYAVLAHYWPGSGALDLSFGIAGYAEPVNMIGARAALQPDGKILLAGQVYNGLVNSYDFGIVRYNANGTLDKTFAGKGMQTTDFSNDEDLVQAVTLQADGKIVVAGFAYDHTTGVSDFALARYNPDGTPDKTFDGDGKVMTDFSGGYEQLQALGISADGKIIAAGQTYIEAVGHNQMAVARYNANGSPDQTFSKDGKRTVDFPGTESYAYDVAAQPDGKIILAGVAGELFPEHTSIALARLTSNGFLDKTFNGDGRLTANFSDSTDGVSAIALQQDGKIVVGGYTYNARTDNKNFLLARYNNHGSLDRSFGKNGITTSDFFTEDDYLNALIIQQDGRILASGEAFNPRSENFDFVASRYHADGSPDRRFGHRGELTGYFDAGEGRINAVAVQEDGKVIVAGDAYAGKTAGDFAVARYNTNGLLDHSFGRDGIVTTDFFGDDDAALAVVIQPDGKIVVAGQATNRENFRNQFAIARYNTNGTLDKKFGNKGTLTVDFFGDDNSARTVALQRDGRIVVAGFVFNPSTNNNDFALARLTTQGLPDMTFDGDGKLTTDFSATDDFISGMALQNDGKIIVAGYRFTQTAAAFALARYNPNGSLDHAFDGDGKVVTDFEWDAFGSAVAIQPDGKIVVGGAVFNFNSNTGDFALARYNKDGTLDKTFDGDGKQTTDVDGADNSSTGLAIQPDGKILMAGTVFNIITNANDVMLSRYETSGVPDKSFDGDGTFISHLNGFNDYTTGLLVKGNKAYLGGYAFTPASTGFVAVYLLGDCSPAKIISNAQMAIQDPDIIEVKVYPNPSTQYFTISFGNKKDKRAFVRVSDEAGRLIETKTNVLAGTTFQLGGRYARGVYYAEVIQGNTRTVVRLLKN